MSSYIFSYFFCPCFVSSFFACKRVPISLIIDPSEAGARKTGLVGTMHWNDGHSIKETKMIFILSVWLSAAKVFYTLNAMNSEKFAATKERTMSHLIPHPKPARLLAGNQNS